MTIRVLIADDHAVLRDGLAALLQADPEIVVVAHAADGRQALRLAAECDPDVAILDIVMPEIDGIEAARQLQRACPRTRVLILSMYSTREHIFRALQAGALGYLLKESAGAEVKAAVHALHAGRRYLGQRITDSVVGDYLLERHDAGPLQTLSRRERQVLQMVAEGRSSASIARSLCLSPKTVDTYRSRLLHKLAVPNVAGLVRFAIECGLTHD